MQNRNLTLQQLFGANADQTATALTITKADLPGLTPAADNRAEQLLVAILLQAWSEFEGMLVDEIDQTVVDETGDAVGYDQRELYEKLHLWFWKRQFIGGRVVDTFVIDTFIKPPPSYSTPLNVSQL